MPTRADTNGGNTATADRSVQQGPLIAQLQRVHDELHAMLALAAQTPASEQYDAALHLLHDEIDALGREFLRLSEALLTRDVVEAGSGN